MSSVVLELLMTARNVSLEIQKRDPLLIQQCFLPVWYLPRSTGTPPFDHVINPSQTQAMLSLAHPQPTLVPTMPLPLPHNSELFLYPLRHLLRPFLCFDAGFITLCSLAAKIEGIGQQLISNALPQRYLGPVGKPLSRSCR